MFPPLSNITHDASLTDCHADDVLSMAGEDGDCNMTNVCDYMPSVTVDVGDSYDGPGSCDAELAACMVNLLLLLQLSLFVVVINYLVAA